MLLLFYPLNDHIYFSQRLQIRFYFIAYSLSVLPSILVVYDFPKSGAFLVTPMTLPAKTLFYDYDIIFIFLFLWDFPVLYDMFYLSYLLIPLTLFHSTLSSILIQHCVFFIKSFKINLWLPDIHGYMDFHWSMVNLPENIFSEQTHSPLSCHLPPW